MERKLNGLLDAHGRVGEEIHGLRKLGKSLRGGFSLFGLGKSSAREIQAIGRLLAGTRDASSRLSTWKKLEWDEEPVTAAAIGALLDQQVHSATRRPPPEVVAWCAARVVIARKHLEELPEDQTDVVGTGLEKLRRKLAKRCRRLDHKAQEDFHDARKAVKAYTGALHFVPQGEIDPKLTELAEILGDENDLATLGVWLEDHGFTTDFAPLLWKRMKSKTNELRKRAMRDAGEIDLAGPKPAA